MEAIGMYLLKSAAWLTGFALVYLLVLRNEHFFRLNRAYLLAGITASLLFPFYTFHYAVILPAITTSTSVDMGELSVGTIVREEASPLPIYFWVYLIGTLAFLFRLLFQTWKIIRKLQKAGYERTGAVKLVRTPEFVSSFSFFSFVFVNPSIAKLEMEEIMNHEREHIQQRHWFDLLLVELICIVQWFNPFAWIYAHLVRQNHEFLADQSALLRTAHPAVYQAALLNQLLGVPLFSLTNSFSYSLNKKRFKMMKKQIDSPFRKLKLLLVLPLAAMLFYAFALPEYRYDTSQTKLAADDNKMEVKGQVTKSDGTPLAGTSVILRNSTIGTLTDKDGNFLLKGMPTDGELVFSFVGFKTVIKKLSSMPMKIVMEVTKVGIEQVTVVGYGTPPPPPPPPLDLTKELNRPNPPLVFKDGVQITKEAMNAIKQDQIQSISILEVKSATAVYGEKGKNGVILITTKKKAWEGSGTPPPPPPPPPPSIVSLKGMDDANPPLIFLDGVTITKAEMDKINPDQIASINVVKDKSATESFGVKAKNGVILIGTKEKASNIKQLFSNYSVQMVEEMPQFPGGQQAWNDFLASVMVYPAEAVKNNNQGLVIVTVTIKSDGKVGNAKISQGVHPLLDNEAVRVVNLSPNWIPGKQKGLPVTASYTIPVNFALDGGKLDKQKIVADAKVPQQRPDGVFLAVEEMPEFPGGYMAMHKFIVETVKYPADAAKAGIQGRVMVSFVVKADGSIGDAKVIKGVYPQLDNEAIRVVNQMPVWKPGKQGGKEVNVAYTVPVQFALDGGKIAKAEFPDAPKILIQNPPDGVFIVVEEMPEYPGGELALRKFIAETIKYPEEAIKDSIQGKVFVTFVVRADGTIGDSKVARGVHPLLDKEAIRVVYAMPKWQPGKQRGEAVNVSYTIPINFVLRGNKVKQMESNLTPKVNEKGEKEVFTVVEEMPEFPGGALELRKFIAKSIIYPAEAQKEKIQGIVYVSFVVSSTGKVENAKVDRSACPALDAEAIRVINLLPEWKPGRQRGQNVSVEYSMPIEFKLQ